MTIKPICDKCGNELTEFGALLFSPPDDSGITKKWHLCKTCYDEMVKVFKSD